MRPQHRLTIGIVTRALAFILAITTLTICNIAPSAAMGGRPERIIQVPPKIQAPIPPQADTQTAPAEAPAQEAEAPPAAPVAPEAPVSDYTAFELQTGSVRLYKRCPAIADLAGTYTCTIDVRALNRATGILVTDTIPNGAKLISTDPEAIVRGSQLSWQLENLNPNQVRTITVKLQPNEAGRLASCSTVTAIPQGCLETFVGKPVLTIEKTGPETARLGNEVEYIIAVSNTGDVLARDVVLSDTLPEGLTHVTGKQALSMNMGSLAPGDVRRFKVIATASKVGKVCNPAQVESSNAGQVKAEACTIINEPKLEIVKSGTKDQFIGKNASYQIVVSNPGTEALVDVVIRDSAPTGARIVAAPGANIQDGTATWMLPELPAGGSKTLAVTLTTARAGTHCNLAAASTQTANLKASAEACTLWKGQAALLIEVVDDPDPILVDGELSTYTINVTNQGTAPDTNIQIVAKFVREIDPVTATGQTLGTVDGKTVSFAPVPILNPGERVLWTIKAKGVATGDHRLRVLLTSDLLDTPVTEEESTHVY